MAPASPQARGSDRQEFADYDQISEYAPPALTWAVNAGLMQGNENQLMPVSGATRAQIAAVFQRFSQNTAE